MLTLRSIVHPTDFSDASAEAFVHALRIAITAKCALTLVHVGRRSDDDEWTAFPPVRATLVAWGLMQKDEPPEAVARALGIKVAKIELAPQSTIGGILRFLEQEPADLIVLATEGREGVARWLHGSAAERLSRSASVPTLFVPARARGFVTQARGDVHLKRVLIPVDHDPSPAPAIDTIMGFARLLAGIDALDPTVEERLLHVGGDPPELRHPTKPHKFVPVAIRKGDVVKSILDAATDWQPDMIGMPTAGHHGFLDALRGSTTERVVRQAPCPVLAVPAN